MDTLESGNSSRLGERSAGLYGLLHVEDEGALLPLHLDELEGVLGDLLAVGHHEGAALLALEVGPAGKGQLAVQLVPARGDALLAVRGRRSGGRSARRASSRPRRCPCSTISACG